MELFHYLNEIELKFMTASEEETEYKPEKMKISIDFQVKRKQDIKVSSMILFKSEKNVKSIEGINQFFSRPFGYEIWKYGRSD